MDDEDIESENRSFILRVHPDGTSNQEDLDELFQEKWYVDCFTTVVQGQDVVSLFVLQRDKENY